jgi:amino acid permease
MSRRLFPDSGEAKSSDTQIFPDRRDSLSRPQFVAVCLRTALAFGMLVAGDSFRLGIIGGILLNVICALAVYYALFIFVEIAAYWRKNTLDNIFTAAYSSTMGLVSTVISCLAGIVINRGFVKRAVTTVWGIFGDYADVIPETFQLRLTIMLFMTIVFVIPFTYVNSLRATYWTSVLCLCMLFLLFAASVYFLYRSINENGFDPGGNLRIFGGSGKDWLFNFVNVWDAFLIAPVAWPGIRHLVNPTAKRLQGAFAYFMTMCCAATIASGIIIHLTFFDSCNGVMMEFYPRDNSIAMLAGYIDVAVLLFTLPAWFNPQRFILLSTLSATENIPIDVWAATGLLMFLLSMCLVEFSGVVESVIDAVGKSASALNLFVFPGWLFLRTYGSEKIQHALGSIILIALGLLSIGIAIWYAIVTEPVPALPLRVPRGPAP